MKSGTDKRGMAKVVKPYINIAFDILGKMKN